MSKQSSPSSNSIKNANTAKKAQEVSDKFNQPDNSNSDNKTESEPNLNEPNLNEPNLSENDNTKVKFGFGNRLNLVPNEVIGYRILPDQCNWTVVLVKKHGPDSKYAGKEYSESLAFCRDIYSAVSWIVRYEAATEGRKSQEAHEKLKGDVANLKALEAVFAKAENAALAAVKNLEERLNAAGIDLKKMTKKMEAPEGSENIVELEQAEE